MRFTVIYLLKKITCMIVRCRYPETRVPSVSSLSSIAPVQDPRRNRLQASPRKEPKTDHTPSTRGRSWPDLGFEITTWQVSSHQMPTKSLAQAAFEPTPDERYGLTKAYVAPLLTHLPWCRDGTLVGVSWQDNMKKSLSNMMMVMPKSPAAEIISQQSSLVPSLEARLLLQIREHDITWLIVCCPLKLYIYNPLLEQSTTSRSGSSAHINAWSGIHTTSTTWQT
jgi:hypothetical protein